MHPLLDGQLRKYFPLPAALPQELLPLFAEISDSYDRLYGPHAPEPGPGFAGTPEGGADCDSGSEKFRSLVENSSDAIVIINEHAETIFVSEAYCLLTGCKPTDVLGSSPFNHVHPEDQPELRSRFQEIMKHPETKLSASYRRIGKDGRTIWCEGTAKNLLHMPEVGGIVVTIRDISDRVKVEEALRNSEHKFRTLIQHSSDVIAIWDAKEKIIFASDSIFPVTGFTVEETVGSNFNHIHPDDVPALNELYAKVMAADGNVVSMEYRRLKKDGSYMWCAGTATNLLSDPDVGGVVVNFRDITERKNYETALRNSERKLRALIENSREAIIVADENLVITYVSDSLQRVAGYKPEDIIGLHILSLAHPDEKDMITAFMQEVVAQPGVPKSLVYKTRKKDGSYIWCERVTTNLLDDPGIAGIVSNFRDITERVEAEEAIRVSEYKFRSLIQNSADVIIVDNEKGERVFVSDSSVRFSGFTADEILGKQSFSLVHPEDKQMANEFMQKVRNKPGLTLKIVYRAMNKDGSYMWCERTSTNLLHDPAIRGIVSNLRDITDRKLQEEELRIANTALKQRNDELDKFVYSVSHDLRAPLTSLLGLIEISRSEDSVEEIRNYLSMMQTSVNKLDSFISDILSYSKNARLEIRSEEIHFDQLLRETTENLRFMNPDAQHVTIRESVSNGIPFHSDKHRIGIILNNLVSNALKYFNPASPDPFVSISVKVSPGKAEIRIEDNGVGIPAEYHDKVFDMFFRASTLSMGSGLGLYIVRETLNKLGGEISMHSEPGKGTTFVLVIPDLGNTANLAIRQCDDSAMS